MEKQESKERDHSERNELKELEELHFTEKMHLSYERGKKDSEQDKDFMGDSSAGSLDFFSPDFDPLKALHTKDLAPPNPRVRPLDNLSSCRKILPEEVPESIINAPAKTPRSAESILAQERAKAHKSVLLLKAAERERQTKILDKIAECYEHKLRVKVWTRHTHGVRGTLTGLLIGFDKHLNLVLRDIDEEYSVRRCIPRLVRRRGRLACTQQLEETEHTYHEQTVQALVDSSLEIRSDQCIHQEADNKIEAENLICQLKELRLFPKLEQRRRHLKQAFLRGDSVVIIQKLL